MAIFDMFGDIFGKGKMTMGDVVGRNINISGKRIIVDGKVISEEATGVIEVVVKEGRVEVLKAGMNITVHGNVEGNADAGMSITCENIGGNADAGMGIKANDIMGSAKAGMSVNAKTVGSKRD